MNYIQQRLFTLQDPSYKAFQSKLMPTVNPDKIIGVRMPALRQLSKELAAEPQTMTEFVSDLPHRYYEKDNLHGLLINRMKDFDACIDALDTPLPYVDNWATCGLLKPVVFRKEAGKGENRLLPHVRRWLASEHIYTCCFCIGVLMNFYLDEHFDPKYLEWVGSVYSDEYYVNMGIAWYFATVLAKQWECWHDVENGIQFQKT